MSLPGCWHRFSVSCTSGHRVNRVGRCLNFLDVSTLVFNYILIFGIYKFNSCVPQVTELAEHWNDGKYRDIWHTVRGELRTRYKLLGMMTKMARMIGSSQPWHNVLLSLGQGGTFFVIANEAFAWPNFVINLLCFYQSVVLVAIICALHAPDWVLCFPGKCCYFCTLVILLWLSLQLMADDIKSYWIVKLNRHSLWKVFFNKIYFRNQELLKYRV